MIRAVFFALGCLLVVNIRASAANTVLGGGDELREQLRRKVKHYSLQQPSFVASLASLASEFGLPMGIEWVQSPEVSAPVKLSWNEATVGEMIAGIVDTQPGYAFEVSNGIVHVFRKDLIHNSSNFLEIKLEGFAASNELPGIVSRRLRATIKRVVAPPPASILPGGEAGSYGTGVGEVPMTFKLNNIRVREVLNHIATSSVFRIWVVTFKSNGLTRTRYFRSASLWNPSLAPEDQPVWDLMVWGHFPSKLVP